MEEQSLEFQTLFENVLDAIMLANDEGQYIDANPAACDLLGYSREELLKLSIQAVMPVEEQARVQELWRRFLAAKRDSGEYLLVHKDGQPIVVEYRATAHIRSGLHLIVLRDITRFKQIQATLQARMQQRATLADLGLYALEEPDLQMFMDKVAQRVASTLEVDYVEILELLPAGDSLRLVAGHGWREGLVGPATVRAGHNSHGGYTLASEQPVIVDNLSQERRFMGSWLLLEHEVTSGVSTIIGEEHRPYGALGAHTRQQRRFTGDDINFLQAVANLLAQAVANERNRAALKASEQRFRILADSSPTLIWESGRDKGCTYFNKNWLAFTGRTMEQELGFGWTEGVHRDDYDRRIATYTGAFEAQAPFEMEYRLRRHDGVYRYILDHGAPKYGPDDSFDGYIGSCIDITERKEAAKLLEQRVAERTQALRVANEQLVTANRALREFSYSISHDLRTPLRAVHGFAEIIRRRYQNDLNEEGRHYFDNIIEASQRMEHLIDDLLTYSRVGTQTVRAEPVKLAEVLARSLNPFKEQIKQMEAIVELPDKMPEVKGDPALLDRVFINLIDNALKYHRSEVQPRIEVEARQENGWAIVSVADNGIGIPEEYQSQIFDIFQRLHPPEAYPGTGIGLAVIRKAMELMGGRVSVESSPGEGSRFVIGLPLAE